MTPYIAPTDEFIRLMSDLAEDRISPEQIDRLDELLRANPANCQNYVDFMAIVTRLAWIGDDEPEAVAPFTAGQLPETLAEWTSDRGRDDSASPSSHPRLESAPSSARYAQLPPLYSAAGNGLAGHFVSGWPVAYLVATVIFGIGLVIGAVVHVSSPIEVIRKTAPLPSSVVSLRSDVVGRITGMVDCVWEGSGFRGQGSESANQKSEIISDKSVIYLGDRLSLRSGLLEITYDSGARAILQGPVTYTVESPASGYLALGKLTAKLEKKSEARGQKSEFANQKSEIRNRQLFSIRTPTALVTDLGTEFGVDVDQTGQSDVCVHSGRVAIQGANASAASPAVVLKAGEARRIPSSDSKSWLVMDAKHTRIAQPLTMPRPRTGGDASGELLFSDSFESFSLGTRWQAIKDGPPNLSLRAVIDGNRTVLAMRGEAENVQCRGIETIEPIPIEGMESVTVSTLFQPRQGYNPLLELHVVGGPATARLIMAPHALEVGADVTVAASATCQERYQTVLSKHYGSNYRYDRFVLSLNAKGVTASFLDSVSPKPRWETHFDKVTLADFGSNVKIVLRQVTCDKGHPSESHVDWVTVRGRRIHRAAQEDDDLHATENLSSTTVCSEVGTVGNGKHVDRKEVSRDK